MVAWYKHDIPDWMDGTEGMTDGAYRLYHVVCQLIYLNEGPIALNEHGIAGRCKQSLRAFRRNLDELLKTGKLTLENGRIANSRADNELETIVENRINAGKGGKNSAGTKKSSRKALKENEPPQASLSDDNSLKEKRRQEETRKDESRAEEHAAAPPSKSMISQSAFALADRVMVAMDLTKDDPSCIGAAYKCQQWLDGGWNPDIVETTIKKIIARGKKPGNLSYFERAIADAHAELAKPLPVGTATGPPARTKTTFLDLAQKFGKSHEQDRNNIDHQHPGTTVIDG